jgi:hypothetical protein
MKTLPHVLFALIMSAGSTAAVAAECTSSFYCYGNTANTVVSVATRPPPIPPPNPRVVQQRRQAQLALRSRPPTPTIARPAATPTPQRATTPTPQRAVTPITQPTPRANIRATPPAQPNRTSSNCQTFLNQASALESQAVIASKQNNRQRSVSLFKEAARLRTQATKMNCR